MGSNVPDEKFVYYYHGDHLGSSNVITDRTGKSYEHIEYFPYGETWVDEHRSENELPYKFTSKELDPETGLYYFGARYYDAKLSKWISVDPILGKYLPNLLDKKQLKKKFKPEKNLPGMGGIYNPANLNLLQYAADNPLKYIDPDGNIVMTFALKAEIAGGPGVQVYTGIAIQFGENIETKAYHYTGANLSAGIRGDYGGDLNIYMVDTIEDLKNARFVTLTGDIGPVGTGGGVSTDGNFDGMINISVGSGLGASFGLPEGTDDQFRLSKKLTIKYTKLVDNINNSKGLKRKMHYGKLILNLIKDGIIEIPEKKQ